MVAGCVLAEGVSRGFSYWVWGWSGNWGVEWWLQVFVLWFCFGFVELECGQLVYDMYKGFLLVNSVIGEYLLKILGRMWVR